MGAQLRVILVIAALCAARALPLLEPAASREHPEKASASSQSSRRPELSREELLLGALSLGDRETALRLLARLANVNFETVEGRTPLLSAVRLRGSPARPQLVRAVLARGVPADRPNRYGEHPLIAAILGAPDDEAVICELLARGARLRVQDRSGLTPLIKAAQEGTPDLVSFLVKRGADPNERTRLGTPLLEATRLHRTELAKQLLELGADPEARNAALGETPLVMTARNGSLALLNVLLAAGAKVNAQDERGYTALMQCVWYGHLEKAKLLLRHGARLGLRDKRGKSARDWAMTAQNAEFLELFNQP